MNIYIIVEGERTETIVYPAWIQLLVPKLKRIDDAWDVKGKRDCYYLFSAGGIPSIYSHVSNAVADINEINSGGEGKYDYLVVCIDVEEESRDYIEQRINEQLERDGRSLNDTKLVIFEHRICMESWFLGNRKVFKDNPQNGSLSEFINFYNVKENDPELMPNIDEDTFATKAQFHYRYLKYMFQERNMRYSKNRPDEVCRPSYFSQLIERYTETSHISSFGRWWELIKSL